MSERARIRVCKKCGSNNVFVVNSRYREKTQTIYRNRACADCGFRFPSMELTLDEYNELLRIKALFDKQNASTTKN